MKPYTTRLSSRDRVVVPEEIRNRLGLDSGARFMVVGEGDVIVLKAREPPKMTEARALLDGVRQGPTAAGGIPGGSDRKPRRPKWTYS